ncbi:NAD(P)-dependent dehydrogenase [Yamadazyma tenuis]|uniref:NAD(P)-binding protein n=1 Tax=Candida tenuis (strain ATCC 10573 / BCRC 21748 / CBS 615 / JCM 9827 / NBRC 10315 / NRRL Y-1498 / VKM Y-70) TaxID=590646 RepID=G3BFD6_CANTC|nr:NAD(P)-binding protein [Yamadazyma tenuis ATCC 10573]EGV60031.1 NAD(P)-binding protein [Yamadazyma tenuis ATCC 10573]WEJ94740.1 NAD(P)-dependent dehydrogenase [Yamadazyma tenuis]
MSTTYLIVGASRGIGFTYVKHLALNKSNLIIATARNENAAAKLEALGPNVKTILIDMQDPYSKFETSFKQLETLAPSGVDVFIQNAGISGPSCFAPPQEYEVDAYDEILAINIGGSAKSYKAAYPYIFKGEGTKKIVFTTSLLGQLGFPMAAQAYAVSKAGINHLGYQVALTNANSEDVLAKNSVTILLHPGIVDTDMTTASADNRDKVDASLFISQDESVTGTLALVDKLTSADNGKFFDYKGEELKYSAI